MGKDIDQIGNLSRRDLPVNRKKVRALKKQLLNQKNYLNSDVDADRIADKLLELDELLQK